MKLIFDYETSTSINIYTMQIFRECRAIIAIIDDSCCEENWITDWLIIKHTDMKTNQY